MIQGDSIILENHNREKFIRNQMFALSGTMCVDIFFLGAMYDNIVSLCLFIFYKHLNKPNPNLINIQENNKKGFFMLMLSCV